MRRFAKALLGIFLLLGLSFPAAAQAVFPNQGSIGLVPPAGMTEIPGVGGFEDRAAKASILIVELPPGAYDTILQTFEPQALQAKGVTVEDRRDIELADGHKGVLLTGYQSVGAIALKKWIMLAEGKGQTAMITVQFPEESAARYSDEAIETALKSLAFRAPPTQEEMLARLPFTISDLGGFRVLRVLGGSAVLLTGAGPDAKGGDVLPYFIVGVARGEIREDERESLAKRALASIPGVKDIRPERGGPLRIAGQPGVEIIAKGTEVQTGKPVKVAQWLSFGRGSYLRMVGVMPEEGFEENFTRLRSLRDAVQMR